MPRDIPLGNGSLQLAFDEHYQIRDLFFPHVGGENHAQGYPFRFGAWVDGEMSWLGPGWEISLDYQDDTLVTQVRAVHRRLGIELECQGAVDFHENLYLRRVLVGNLADRPRRVLLFFHHDFNVGQSDLGNTALFDPGPFRHGLGRGRIGAQGRAARDRFLSIEGIQGDAHGIDQAGHES